MCCTQRPTTSTLHTHHHHDPPGDVFLMMQTATSTIYAPPLGMKQAQPDPAQASVGHLLSKAYSLPCSTATQGFTQLVAPMNRFQIALDVLLPLLYTPSEVCLQRSSVARHAIQILMIPTAREADPRRVYPLLLVRTSSDWHQPLPVCSVCYVCQGT